MCIGRREQLTPRSRNRIEAEGALQSPREIFERQFKAAAAEGAMYELHMRLLADKVPELRPSAYGERLENVEG